VSTRVLFAGGGTGGHLYPGLAIARALVRLDPAVHPHFIGAQRGVEREVLPTSGFPYTLLDLHPLYRQRPWQNWKTLAGGVSAWRGLSALVREQRPAAIVGTGGYAAGVALAWGRGHGVPIVLHEPDSHPGLTTRAFAGGARALYLGFPEAAARLSPAAGATVHAFGCPIEPPPVPRLARAEARRAWGLQEASFVVLVVGGSQGARAINDTVAAWVQRGLPPGLGLIWATGRQQAAAYAEHEGPLVRVRPYLAPISEAYAAADMAVSRAGAMSIAELCAWGIPPVLVPLPTAAQDHQAHNARATAVAGAAIHLPQSELSAEQLDRAVRELRDDPARMQSMQEAAARRARPDAADAIARDLLRLIGRTA
jgi:UDP-N-acetylglucosamine--N-acetylmuramyl-(pentapeptide) pyrophosphoryl-undecaprenol N-acetylglucosamine transferase